MPEPAVIIGSVDEGYHNRRGEATTERIRKGKAYRDLSTVCVIPTRGLVPARVVESWINLMTPMNNKFVRIFMQGMEVGDAYNRAVEIILENEGLKDFKYLLTLEEDNMPPPDGLLRLYENIDEYAVVGGLYYTKGEGGQPMIYGDPKGLLTFEPQIPVYDQIQECNGLGMGFTLFDMKLFKDPAIEQPWFKTVQEYSPETGAALGTQDLFFFAKARKAGYKVASDNRVRVSHWDQENLFAW